MSEQDLVRSMLSMAAGRGVDTERAAEEIAAATFPSFIDQRAIRAALMTHVEDELRRQMERRIDDLRRRFEVEGDAGKRPVAATPAPAFAPPTPAATPPSAPVTPATPPPAPTPAPGVDTSFGDATQIGQDMDPMPSDATMVWTTRPRS